MIKLVTRSIVKVAGLFLLANVALFGFVLANNSQVTAYCATPLPPILFCGTTTSELSVVAQQGKLLFQVNCASCHGLTKRRTGPAMGAVDSILLRTWLVPNTSIQNKQATNKMGKSFHMQTLDITSGIMDIYKGNIKDNVK